MKLNLMTSMSNTGYGIVGKNIARELSALDTDITLWPYGNIQSERSHTMFKAMVDRQNWADRESICLNIWHQFDLAKRIGNGTYYAWPFFELNQFNDREKAHLRFPHYLIASSEWAKNILQEALLGAQVYVVPCGVDTSVFCPEPKKNEDRPYTFLNIGKWEKRKGHDILIRAFDKAFSEVDDVKLVMMPHNPFLREHQQAYWTNMYSQSKLHSKITLLNPVQYHYDVATVINKCDCGVYPSHAEGWNLELLETMACNKPVIATNNSGHTEFCTRENAFLIDTPNMETAYDGIWFTGQGEWAEIDVNEEEQLIAHMKHCYQNRIRTNQAGIRTANKFTWTNAAKRLLEIFEITS